MHTVNASVVSIGLTIFLLIFGAFYTISTGSFITRYRDLMSVYTTPPQVVALEEPLEEEDSHGEGRWPE